MKKYIFALVVYLLISASAYGYSDVKTRLYVKTKNGFTFNGLVFGISKDASVDLDTALGEWEVPPPPPEGVLGGFRVFDPRQNSNIFAFIDLRPYPAVEMVADTHYLQIWAGAGDLITFSWNPLGPEIVSAKIVDAMTMGNLINVNMKDSSNALISNEFVQSFYIMVTYNSGSSVSLNAENHGIKVFPSNAVDNLHINSEMVLTRYDIIDLSGKLIQSGNIDFSSEIRVGNIDQGAYLLRLFDNNGQSYLSKFVKLK
jgi:hypothetical protein